MRKGSTFIGKSGSTGARVVGLTSRPGSAGARVAGLILALTVFCSVVGADSSFAGQARPGGVRSAVTGKRHAFNRAGAELLALRNQNSDASARINSRSVKDLTVLWQVKSKDLITHEPLVHNSRVYFADWGGKVYSVDALSGKVIWEKSIEQVDPTWGWHGFAGTGVVGNGVLFEASAEGNLFAINLQSGDVIWKAKFTEKPFAGSIGTLLYYRKTVYVPVSSLDEGMDQQKGFVTDFQGCVEAYDAVDGKHVWEFETVTDSGNGAAVWGGFALDVETNTLYFTTGNNYTGEATKMSDAIIAVDASTGEFKWSRQCTEGDIWTVAQPKNGPDYDFGAAPQLFETKIDGKMRKLVAACQKSGTLWVLDRMNGAVVWTAKLGAGSAGGGFMAPAAIDKTMIYAWANNAYPYGEPEKHPMDVAAFDQANGNILWKKAQAQPAWLTEAGFLSDDVFLVGSLDGKIRAYVKKNGELVWTSRQMDSISTSIFVSRDRMYFGTGIPSGFGGRGESGTVYCLGITE